MDDDERAMMRALTAQLAAQADQIRELTSFVRANISTQKVVSPLTAGLTVVQIWEKYGAAMKTELKPRSWMAIASRMKPVLKRFGTKTEGELSAIDEASYRTMRLGTTTRLGKLLSRLSYNNEMGAFLGVINWAVNNDLWTANPLRKVKLKNTRKKRKTVYSEDDADIVFEAASEWLCAMILVCKEAGLRPIELLTLEWTQIDRATRFVHLREDQTKNGKARSMKLSERALQAIDGLPRGIRWVFTNPRTGKHWSHSSLDRWWRAVRKEASLQGAPGETARFYDWRGTFATTMDRAGVSLPVIREALGHADYKQLEMYLRIDNEDLAAGADRLEEHIISQRRRGPKRAPIRDRPGSNSGSGKNNGR